MVLEYRVRYIQATQLKQVLFQCRDCKDLIAHQCRSFAIPSCNNFEKDCSNSSQVHSITIIWLHQIHFKSTRHHQASGASSATCSSWCITHQFIAFSCRIVNYGVYCRVACIMVQFSVHTCAFPCNLVWWCGAQWALVMYPNTSP